ncbi:MAG: hypothetical protein ABIJ97_03815, partial [Bacteroidota bacterium]
QLFIDAQKEMQLGNPQSALDILIKLHETDPANSNINYLIGFCYYNFKEKNDKLKSIPYLTKATQNVSPEYKTGIYKETNAPPITLLYLGEMYYLNYDFDNALKYFEQYKPYILDPLKIEYLDKISKYALNGQTYLKNPVQIDILNLGDTVNSEFDDHSPVVDINETKMVFTSKRKGSTGNLKTTDGQYFEDIYLSIKENGQWQLPEKISYNINTMEHEASIALSVDGNELFIYKDDVGEGGNLYNSFFANGDWSKPQKLGSNINTEYNEEHATISPDGRTLYFTSNRPGGYGGYDIYYVNRLPNGEWGLALSMGDIINTAFDEAGPFIHQDGTTLYFSSNCHRSMGGFDLFFSVFKDDGTITEPQNLGYPINTIENDLFYVLSSDGKRAYYSSEKKDTRGKKDIYLMDLASLPERSLIVISGTIQKQGTGEIIYDAVLTVNDAKTDNIIGEFKPNKTSGKYLLVLPKSKTEYIISCDKGEFVNNKIIIPNESSFYYLRKPIILNPIGIIK